MPNHMKNLTEDMIVYVIDPGMVDISSYPTIMFYYRIASAEGLLTDIGIRPSCQLLAIAFILVGTVSSLECIIFIRQQSVLPAGHLFKFGDQRLGTGIAAHHSFQFLLTGALAMIVVQNDDLRSLEELKEDYPRLYPFFIQRGSYAIGNTAGAQAVAVLGGLCLFYILKAIPRYSALIIAEPNAAPQSCA
ncbi:unnamed protein product, partial [Mesorhabditis spiculigera]